MMKMKNNYEEINETEAMLTAREDEIDRVEEMAEAINQHEEQYLNSFTN